MKLNYKKYLRIFSAFKIIKFDIRSKTNSILLFKILIDLIKKPYGYFYCKSGALLVLLYKPQEDLVEILWAKNHSQILVKNKIYMDAYFKYKKIYGKDLKYISWRRNKTNKFQTCNVERFLILLNRSTELKHKVSYL